MKMIMRYFAIIVLFIACGHNPKSEIKKISDPSPFSIEIKRERSYFQAEKVNSRLQADGYKSYIMSVEDSIAGGQWYAVMIGAETDSATADSIKSLLEEKLNIDSLAILDYTDSGKIILDPDSVGIPERKQITAQKPKVPENIFQVIQKFPNSNMFYIKSIEIVNCDYDGELSNISNNLYHIDLPRGIYIKHMIKYADAWAETIYNDNIYGDPVTIDVIKLSDDHDLTQKVIKSSMLPVDNDEYQFKIAEHFADLILGTDEYAVEVKEEISEQAYNTLKGYKVVLETKSGILRTYLVLVDQESQFLFFCQSIKKSLEDLQAVVRLIGKGIGMNEFDEFYNAFYLIPSEFPENDTFLTFSMYKLDWSYAKSKGYTSWSKKMVGHWHAQTNFVHTTQGLWSFSIFDMLTAPKVDNIYYTLYSNERDTDDYIEIWGKTGFRIDSWYSGLEEINFAHDRFISCVNRNGELDIDDMINRAHLIQFYKGGYANFMASVDDSTQNL